MKTALAAALLILVVGCGGGGGLSDADRERLAQDKVAAEASASASASAAALDQTCMKLGRTWAVKANDAIGPLLLMLSDKATDIQTALSDVTEQMKIEGCEQPYVQAALMGNYALSKAILEDLVCERKSVFSCGKAGDVWKKEGVPALDAVKGAVGLQ